MTVFLAHLTNLRPWHDSGLLCLQRADATEIAQAPGSFTVLFFAVELTCLWIARERNRPAWLLPVVPLLILWASVHIQFVYGLGLIGLFALELSVPDSLREKISVEPRPALGSQWLWSLLAAGSLATLVNPYGWNLYRVVAQYATETVPLTYVKEMQALPFRTPSHWLALGLIGAVRLRARVSAEEEPSADCRPGLLVLLRVFVRSVISGFRLRSRSFRLPSAMRSAPGSAPARFLQSPFPLTFAVVFLFIAEAPRFSNDSLHESVEKRFPEKAADYIQAHELEGPLYNTYNWGGYLIWRLPRLPVSIDGRANLYEDSLEDPEIPQASKPGPQILTSKKLRP